MEINLAELSRSKRKAILKHQNQELLIDRWTFLKRCRMNNPDTGRPFANYEEYINGSLDQEERKLLAIYTSQLIEDVNEKTLNNLTIISDYFFVPTQKRFNFSHEYYVRRLKEETESSMLK